jgi:hypothetical protein
MKRPGERANAQLPGPCSTLPGNAHCKMAAGGSGFTVRRAFSSPPPSAGKRCVFLLYSDAATTEEHVNDGLTHLKRKIELRWQRRVFGRVGSRRVGVGFADLVERVVCGRASCRCPFFQLHDVAAREPMAADRPNVISPGL